MFFIENGDDDYLSGDFSCPDTSRCTFIYDGKKFGIFALTRCTGSC